MLIMGSFRDGHTDFANRYPIDALRRQERRGTCALDTEWATTYSTHHVWLRPETFVLDHMTVQNPYRQSRLHCPFASEKVPGVQEGPLCAFTNCARVEYCSPEGELLAEILNCDMIRAKAPRQGIARRARVIQCLRASKLLPSSSETLGLNHKLA